MASPRQPGPLTATLTAALVLGGLVLWGPASAASYRWVDSAGVVAYSQFPPSDRDADVIEVQFQLPAPEVADAIRRKTEQTHAEGLDRREELQRAAAEKAKTKAAEARRSKQCALARHNESALEGPGGRRVRYPDNTYEDLTGTMVKAQYEQARQQVAELCKPVAAPKRTALRPSLGAK